MSEVSPTTPAVRNSDRATLWIESHIEIGRHPKIRALARQAGISIPTAVGHLHLLWHFAMEFAPDGNLSRFSPQDIEGAIMWDGDVTVMYALLSVTGWLDVDDSDEDDILIAVHDWPVYAGRLLEQREKSRERARRHREKTAAESGKESGNGDVTVTSRARNALTVPNRTVPKSKESNDSLLSVAPKKSAREQDEIWNAVVAAVGEPSTKSERSDFGKTVSELKDADATPEQIRGFPAWWRGHFPDAELTHRCLRLHWGKYRNGNQNVESTTSTQRDAEYVAEKSRLLAEKGLGRYAVRRSGGTATERDAAGPDGLS